MDVPTYQQVLADMYEENAPVVLVQQNEYEEEVPPVDNHPDELDAQEEFQKFKPRHAPENLIEHMDNKNFDMNLFNKHTQLRIVNIDSRFRNLGGIPSPLKSTTTGNPTTDYLNNLENASILKTQELNSQTSSTNFIFRLQDPIKNVISVRLSSIEIPNSFYTFSKAKENLSFEMTFNGSTKTITILPGIWDSTIYDTSVDIFSIDSSSSLLYQVAYQINFAFNITDYSKQFKVVLNPATGKIYISDVILPATSSTLFSINWKLNDNLSSDFGLGYSLGFRQSTYNATGQINAEAILNTIDTNYLFLSLDKDWKVVNKFETPGKTQLYSFAKIIINVPKFSVNYDDGQNTLTKEYFFKQPANISSFPVRLSDPYDQDIDLNGLDFSFTLEFREVLNSALYETMRS